MSHRHVSDRHVSDRHVSDRHVSDRYVVESLVADGLGISGAVAPGLRFHFADVTREPVPEYLAALLRKLETEPDNGSKGDETHGPKSDGPTNHEPSTWSTPDPIGGEGRDPPA